MYLYPGTITVSLTKIFCAKLNIVIKLNSKRCSLVQNELSTFVLEGSKKKYLIVYILIVSKTLEHSEKKLFKNYDQ
jgi:hypothetical protein